MITMRPGVWIILRGWPWLWSCIRPMGKQCASGLSLLFEATRCRCSSAAQGWKGRPSLNCAPRFQKGLVLTESGMISGVAEDGAEDVGGGAGVGTPGTGLGRSCCQTPERSGLPSAVLGAGPDKFGLPSAVLGTPGVG